MGNVPSLSVDGQQLHFFRVHRSLQSMDLLIVCSMGVREGRTKKLLVCKVRGTCKVEHGTCSTVGTMMLTKSILPPKKAAVLIILVKVVGFYNFVTDPLANSRRILYTRF